MISTWNRLVCAAFAGGLLTLAFPARANTPRAIGARVSQRGIDFISEQVRRLVPTENTLPDFQSVLYDCPLTDNDPTLYVTNGHLTLHMDAVQLTPMSGTLDGFIQLDAQVTADARITKPYACFGEANCHITATAQNLMIRPSFAVRTTQGQVDVELTQIDITVAPNDFNVDSSGCALGDFAVGILDLFKGWILDHVKPRIEDMARQQIQPRLTAALQSLTAQSGQMAGFNYTVGLSSLQVDPAGVTALVDADVAWGGPAAACIPDRPPPAAGPAGRPALSGHADQLSIALAGDLMNDALDAAWRSGRLCLGKKDMTGALAGVVDQLPLLLELPAGSTVDFSLRSALPPTVDLRAAAEGQPAHLTVALTGMTFALDMAYPGGGSGHLEVVTDLSANAHVDIDPATNALGFELLDVKVARLDISGSQGTILKFDPARVEQLIRDLLLPKLAEAMSSLPLTSAVLHADASSALANVYLIVNSIDGDDRYGYVFADFFAKPEQDGQPPQTGFAETPPPLTHPGLTRFLFSGSDDKTPTRLLRFRTRVDGGAWSEPSFAHAAYAPASDGAHQLEVMAVDLNDNQDPTPIGHSFVVDAIPPTITLTKQPPEIVHTRTVFVAFQGSDDRTPPDQLRYRWKLRQLDQATGQTKTLREQDFVGGTGSFDVATPGNGQYVLEVAVQDQAGNQSSAQAKFVVFDDSGCQAAPPGAKGAGAGGTGAGVLVLAGLAAAIATAWGRRRGRR